MGDDQRWTEDARDALRRELANARDTISRMSDNAHSLRARLEAEQRVWRKRNPNTWGAICLGAGLVLGLLLGSAGDAKAAEPVEYLMARIYSGPEGLLVVCTPIGTAGDMQCAPAMLIAPPQECRDPGVGKPMECAEPGKHLAPERPS